MDIDEVSAASLQEGRLQGALRDLHGDWLDLRAVDHTRHQACATQRAYFLAGHGARLRLN
jgi:hypothetical protein